MTTIQTNLNLDDMVNVLREHFKGVNNKEFILDTLNYHYKDFHLITFSEYNMLRKEYNV